MPLHANAEEVVRKNLQKLQNGDRVSLIAIGTLTCEQLVTINTYKTKRGLPSISGEVVFIGGHIYKSRILKDGYSIEDVVLQITRAFDSTSTVINGGKMTALRNPVKRDDGYGNQVRDEIVLECSSRHPRSELFSVIPRGDENKPSKTKEAASLVAASSFKI
jgi:hypothetical protein